MSRRKRTSYTGSFWILASIIGLGWLTSDAMAVHLRGRIVSVGFPASDRQGDTGQDHYKEGRWVPVRVDLTNDDGDLFNGWIEVRQPDRDGDPVVARQQISIRESRRYFLYVPASKNRRETTFNVRVFAESGALVQLFNDRNEKIQELVPAGQIKPVNPNTLVILDISDGGLNQLRRMVDDQKNKLSIEDVIVARCAPSELPDLVAGLEMADVIVWDAADPSASTIDLPQREALLEWVRRGGTLILGVGKNWEFVNRSAFGDLLPAKLTGMATTSSSQVLSKHACELLFGVASPVTPELRTPLKYCPIKRDSLLPGAESVVPHETAESQADEYILAAARPCGRGRIILVAAEMKELLQLTSTPNAFLRQLIRVRLAKQDASNNQQLNQFGGNPGYRDIDLHRFIEDTTSFEVTASVYFLFAFLFVVGYIVAATAGSWTWMKKRNLVRYSWPVFAVLSVGASATSLLAVRLVRGIGNSVESLTIVDGQAGSPDVGAVCYLGMKTASYSSADLSLPTNWLDIENSPENHASLRPRWYEQGYLQESTYSAGMEYSVAPIAGQLQDVLFRATSKQFEGRWAGTMPGRLNAALYRDRLNAIELRGESWIENKLGTDLDTCYLFFATRGFAEDEDRHLRIFCYDFKTPLRDGKRVMISTILSEISRDASRSGSSSNRRDPAAEAEDEKASGSGNRGKVLREMCKEWAIKVGSRPEYQDYRRKEDKIEVSLDAVKNALLLLTFYEELDQWESSLRRLDRSEGRVLDASQLLTRDTALFVGFSNDPGPARLCWRRAASNGKWKPIEPDQSRTMYRFTIPIRMERTP